MHILALSNMPLPTTKPMILNLLPRQDLVGSCGQGGVLLIPVAGPCVTTWSTQSLCWDTCAGTRMQNGMRRSRRHGCAGRWLARAGLPEAEPLLWRV